jgi:hypothetical protein
MEQQARRERIPLRTKKRRTEDGRKHKCVARYKWEVCTDKAETGSVDSRLPGTMSSFKRKVAS